MDRDELARIALRHDTAMSRAMLRALGIPVPHRAAPRRIERVDRLDGLRECFANKRHVNL